MATLTQAQIQQYYATEGKKANPLSPTAWLAAQTAPAASTTPIVSNPTLPQTNLDAISAQIKTIQDQANQIAMQVPTATGVPKTPTVTPPVAPKTPATLPVQTETPVTKANPDDAYAKLTETLDKLTTVHEESQAEQQKLLNNLSTKTSSDTLKAIQDMQASSSESLQAYIDEQNALIDEIKNQPSAVEALKTFREQQGLPQIEAQLATIDQTIVTTEGLLNNIEADVRKRTEGLPVSEAAARRLTAMEQAPISKQLTEQLSARQKIAAGLEAKQNTVNEFMTAQQQDLASKKELINAKLGVSEKKYEATTSLAEKAYTMFSDLQDKLNTIDLKQLDLNASDEEYKTKLLELGFTAYQQLRAEQTAGTNRGEDFQNELVKMKLQSELNKADNAYSTTVEQKADGTFVAISVDKNTGKATVQDLGVVGKGGGNYGNVASALYKVGLPTNIASSTGEMNKSYLDKLTSKGIPADTATGIYDAIISGSTLEEIRQYFRQNGIDPVILDTFMTTLQGI